MTKLNITPVVESAEWVQFAGNTQFAVVFMPEKKIYAVFTSKADAEAWMNTRYDAKNYQLYIAKGWSI